MTELDDLHSVRWEMNDEGGGSAFVFAYRDETLVQQEHFFDSLDELPDHLAEAIRKDGGCFGSGSTRAEVSAVMGAPDSVVFGEWVYGRSGVTFGYGTVLDIRNVGGDLRVC